MTAETETELKLNLTPDAAEALAASGLFKGRPRTDEQRALYFDTAGHDLAAAGVSLRIRNTGGKRLQTIKQGDAAAAGLFGRLEWNMPVRTDIPVPDIRKPLADVIGAQARLAPLFAVTVTRRVWTMDHDGARIEAVIDAGTVESADRRSSICECELELIKGPKRALFSLARRVGATVPVSLGVAGKSERGYRLIAPLPQSVKAEAVALSPDLPAAEAFARIVQSCLRQFRLNEDLLLATRAPEPLHQARVALRRLRSAFTLFRPMLGDHGAGLRDELRWLAQVLGEARDLDVLVDRAPDGPLGDRLRKARETAHDRVAETLQSGRARGLMLDLAEWITIGDWLADPATLASRSTDARGFSAAALSRFRRRIVQRGQDLTGMADEARHEVRKDAKKLRYAADFFAPLWKERHPKAQKRFAAALGDFQDAMGALNDIAAAPLVLKRLKLQSLPGADALLAAGDRDVLLSSAQDAHDRLSETRKYWT